MISRLARSSAARHLSRVDGGLPTSRWTTAFAGSTVRSFSVTDRTSTVGQVKTTFCLPDPTIKSNYHQLTKIVATIGPTSEQEEPLKRVAKAGMKIMRLNFSHATTEEVELRMKNLALAQVRGTKAQVEGAREM
jgi:Pyruvate kinase, barrel domain